MPRVGDVFQLLSGTLAVPNTTIASGPYNAQQNDWVTEANSPRPVSAGGTGETTASEARESLGALGAGDLAAADTKATPVDTDSVVIIDSEDDDKNKRWLISAMRSYLQALDPPTAQANNRLVNGGFQVSQEQGSISTTANGAYPADQWRVTYSGLTTGVASVTRQVALDNMAYRLTYFCLTAQPAITTGYWILQQRVEGIRIADFNWQGPDDPSTQARHPVVLRFRIRPLTDGTFSFYIRNSPATHTYVGSFTVTVSEVANVIEKVIAIPAPPVGSVWAVNTNTGLELGFTMASPAANLAAMPGWYASGTLYGVTGQSNWLANNGSEIAFSEVGLYRDPDGTGVAPKWEMPDEAEELRACERYFQKSYPIGVFGGAASGVGAEYWTTICSTTGTDWGALKFRTRMRTTAAMTLYAQAGGAAGNVTVQALTKPGQASNASDTGCWVRVTGSSGLTAGTGSMSFQWLANARL